MSAIRVEGGQVAGIVAEELATRFGSPLYVYDFDVITARVRALRAVLPPTFELAYAVKANPALAVLAEMSALGLGLDIASGGELLAAQRIGFDPARVVFTGPGKTDADLAAAVGANLRAITVESAGELARLERIAAAADRRVPILLRVAIRGEGEETPILAGGWRKFGIDPSELDAVARRACDSPWIDLLGVHAFGASNVRDADAIADHVARTVTVARDLARRTGFDLRLVDAGGGLGIPYVDGEQPLDLDRLSSRLAGAEVPILLEPGRYLVGPAGVVLTRVLDVKRVGDRTVAIIDAGIHTALRPALIGAGHRVKLLATGEREAGDVIVAGPLCTGLDVHPEGLRRVPNAGDLVAILDLGAYGFTESMPNFLSHPVPAEVAIRSGRSDVIRPRIEPQHAVALQRVPTLGAVRDPIWSQARS